MVVGDDKIPDFPKQAQEFIGTVLLQAASGQ